MWKAFCLWRAKVAAAKAADCAIQDDEHGRQIYCLLADRWESRA